ncbi:MAG TPA: metal-sensitive transcriptional regulator [Clostridia bacterium]|nr:metal-sensitive transcriptional regulator [Clostridia bacterium]
MNAVHKNRNEIDNRLATIEGHIKGVRQMVADDKNCDDILLQLSALKGSIEKLSKMILIEHANTCVRKSVEQQNLDEYSHFVEVLSKYL